MKLVNLKVVVKVELDPAIPSGKKREVKKIIIADMKNRISQISPCNYSIHNHHDGFAEIARIARIHGKVLLR